MEKDSGICVSSIPDLGSGAKGAQEVTTWARKPRNSKLINKMLLFRGLFSDT
jgi:hypothetical protein